MVCGCVPNPFTSTAENEVWDPDASGTKLACVLSSAGPPTCGPGLVSGGLWPCSSRLWSGIRRRLRSAPAPPINMSLHVGLRFYWVLFFDSMPVRS